MKLEFHGHRFSLNFSWIFSVGQNRTGDLYIFDKKEQKCQHRSLHGVVFRQQCLPANASYGGTVSLGPAGSGGLSVQVQTWGEIYTKKQYIFDELHCVPKKWPHF